MKSVYNRYSEQKLWISNLSRVNTGSRNFFEALMTYSNAFYTFTSEEFFQEKNSKYRQLLNISAVSNDA